MLKFPGSGIVISGTRSAGVSATPPNTDNATAINSALFNPNSKKTATRRYNKAFRNGPKRSSKWTFFPFTSSDLKYLGNPTSNHLSPLGYTRINASEESRIKVKRMVNPPFAFGIPCTCVIHPAEYPAPRALFDAFALECRPGCSRPVRLDVHPWMQLPPRVGTQPRPPRQIPSINWKVQNCVT